MCGVCVIVVDAYMYALWAYTLYMYAVITALHVQSDTDIFIVVGDQRSSYSSTVIDFIEGEGVHLEQTCAHFQQEIAICISIFFGVMPA